MRNLFAIALVSAACGFAGGLLGSAVPVLADGIPATSNVPDVIAWHGRVELDGVAYNGEMRLRFALYDGAGAASASWTEQQDVVVYAGAVAAQLGAISPIRRTITAADDLYLGVSIVSVGGVALPEEVVLAGRQRVTPAPYAMWAAEAADLSINRDLFVSRNASVSGNLNVEGTTTNRDLFVSRNASVSGNLDVDGTTTLNGLALDADTDITGADLIQGHNDLRLSGSDGSDDLVVRADGTVFTDHSAQIGNAAGETLGVGTAPTGAVLSLRNIIGSGSSFDAFGDYSLLLYNGGTASRSYGLGIEGATLAFNSDYNFRWYSRGGSVMLLDSSGNLSTNGTVAANAFRATGTDDTAYRAADASGYEGYGAGYNDTWASCPVGRLVTAVRPRKSPVTNQMLLEVRCSP